MPQAQCILPTRDSSIVAYFLSVCNQRWHVEGNNFCGSLSPGVVLWRQSFTGSIPDAPTVVGDVLFVTSSNGKLLGSTPRQVRACCFPSSVCTTALRAWHVPAQPGARFCCELLLPLIMEIHVCKVLFLPPCPLLRGVACLTLDCVTAGFVLTLHAPTIKPLTRLGSVHTDRFCLTFSFTELLQTMQAALCSSTRSTPRC